MDLQDFDSARPAETGRPGYHPATLLKTDSLTGYTIITAENLDKAEAIARSNPFVTSIRVYELAGS